MKPCHHVELHLAAIVLENILIHRAELEASLTDHHVSHVTLHCGCLCSRSDLRIRAVPCVITSLESKPGGLRSTEATPLPGVLEGHLPPSTVSLRLSFRALPRLNGLLTW